MKYNDFNEYFWQRWDSNPRPRRDWCLKPAPWTARPRYLLYVFSSLAYFELIYNFGTNAGLLAHLQLNFFDWYAVFVQSVVFVVYSH